MTVAAVSTNTIVALAYVSGIVGIFVSLHGHYSTPVRVLVVVLTLFVGFASVRREGDIAFSNVVAFMQQSSVDAFAEDSTPNNI
ncbi:hypothetical protein H257_08814, partial [Aphanomyces astaci]